MTDPIEEELKAVEKEIGVQFTPPTGALCFLDQQRVCAADCVAWNTAYEHKVAQSPDACVLLATVAQLNIGILSVGQLLSKAQRSSQTPPIHFDPPKAR